MGRPTKSNPDDALITYHDALPLFARADICAEIRTVRRHIWANPEICPVVKDGYHFRRVRLGNVKALVAKIVRERWPDEAVMPAKGGGK